MVCPFAVLRSRFGLRYSRVRGRRQSKFLASSSTGGARNFYPCTGEPRFALRHLGAQSSPTPYSSGAQAKSSVLILSTELFTELSPYYFPQTFALRSAFTKIGASKIETTTAKTALIPEVISFVLHESAAALASLPLSISVINDLPMESTM